MISNKGKAKEKVPATCSQLRVLHRQSTITKCKTWNQCRILFSSITIELSRTLKMNIYIYHCHNRNLIYHHFLAGIEKLMISGISEKVTDP